MDKRRHLLSLVRPDTIVRRHRNLLKRRHAATCTPKRRGRPPTVRSIRALVLRLAHENSSWGYRRIHGELAALGIKVAASTVWEVLREHGIPPAPERQSTTWADFLRSQADALLACDLFETRTLTGARLYVFGLDLSPAMVDHARRAHPALQFDEARMEALPVEDGALGGVLAHYSMIHTPPRELPALLAEQARVLAPGGLLLVSFSATDGPEPVRFDHTVMPAYSWPVDRFVELLAGAGLVGSSRTGRHADRGGLKSESWSAGLWTESAHRRCTSALGAAYDRSR
ncbi:methyltransferase domain-containing protein [Streptomyces sp. NPDC056227]|uniref:methyltransferase domain-containing protein n=1 Tax=Streptomyces sp. NPDC056227 TaxID=3345753 RepID=UPI0035E31253